MLIALDNIETHITCIPCIPCSILPTIEIHCAVSKYGFNKSDILRVQPAFKRMEK